MSSELPSETTQKTSEQRKSLPAPKSHAHLVLVLECQDPQAGSARYELSTIDRVILGRGSKRGAKRVLQSGAQALQIAIADRRMSSEHARLVRKVDGWTVEDCDSTNGTWINGERMSRASLRHGDLIELGHTLLLFCELEQNPQMLDSNVDQSSEVQPGFFTLNPQLSAELDRLQRIAASPVPVLLRGETGTGKEVLAGSIHKFSGRPGPLVAVNCGAIPASLVEAQLFGHVKGAFSGAVRDELGFVRAANYGTLFLDEVGDLPLASQAALLRVLQEGQVVPIGTSRPVSVDIRVISATHLPLEELIERGTFRRDLYARLAAFEHRLLPLRERREDTGALITSLLRAPDVQNGPELKFRPEAARALLSYSWPLNVRELKQCLATSSVLATDQIVTLDTLPHAVRNALDAEPEVALSEDQLSPEQIQLRDELVERLRETGGNVSEVARGMSKARQQVQRWLRRFGLDAQRYKP